LQIIKSKKSRIKAAEFAGKSNKIFDFARQNGISLVDSKTPNLNFLSFQNLKNFWLDLQGPVA